MLERNFDREALLHRLGPHFLHGSPGADEQAESSTEIPLLGGIGEEQWKYWHNHPVTLLVRQYFQDRAADIQNDVLDSWRNGKLSLHNEENMRGLIGAMEQVFNLTFEEMRSFYAEQAKQARAKPVRT